MRKVTTHICSFLHPYIHYMERHRPIWQAGSEIKKTYTTNKQQLQNRNKMVWRCVFVSTQDFMMKKIFLFSIP